MTNNSVEHQLRTERITDYPLVLTAKQIAKIMQVSDPTAYAIMNLADFPLMKWEGKGKRVGRDAFFQWFNQRSNGGYGVNLERGEINKEIISGLIQAMEEVVSEQSKKPAHHSATTLRRV